MTSAKRWTAGEQVSASDLNASVVPVGMIAPFAGVVAPTDWLLADGAAISRSTYADLFAVLNPSLGTATISVASPAVVSKTAHGLVLDDIVYFTTTGSLPNIAAGTVSIQAYLVAAGGGSTDYSGGGGAGGRQYNASFSVAEGSYSVVIGQGTNYNDGGNTTFSTMTAIGGGRGTPSGAPAGIDGGCGGGKGEAVYAGGTGSQGGNGANAGSGSTAGGGGGHGGNGEAGNAGGRGGVGLANPITGSTAGVLSGGIYYLGGGGGGGNGASPATGGLGGGGNASSNGDDYTGGGAGSAPYGGGGRRGGHGICILAYLTGSCTATGGTITTSGAYTIHTFTADGTFVVSVPVAQNHPYYVISAGLTADAFEFSLTKGGSAVNTSGTQSGTHTLLRTPYGVGNGSTTFNVPNLKNRIPIGRDSSTATINAVGEEVAMTSGSGTSPIGVAVNYIIKT